MIKDLSPNAKIYIQINDNEPLVSTRGSFILDGKIHIVNKCIEKAIEMHSKEYPNEQIKSVKLISNNIEQVL